MLCCVKFLPIGGDRHRVFEFDAFDKISPAAHSAKGRGSSIDAAHARALFAGAPRNGKAVGCGRAGAG